LNYTRKIFNLKCDWDNHIFTCGNKVEKIKDLYIYYNNISNFPFINPEYIYDIYSKIKCECQEHNYVQFLEFLEYFKKNLFN